jgi:enoyl-CoA hydratase/carnithine racemase
MAQQQAPAAVREGLRKRLEAGLELPFHSYELLIFIAHSGLGRVGSASKTVSHTRSFRLTQTVGERFRNMPKVSIAKIEGRARGGGSEIALAMDMCFAAADKAIFGHPEVAVWTGSGRRRYAKIATAHRAGTRLGSAPGLQ